MSDPSEDAMQMLEQAADYFEAQYKAAPIDGRVAAFRYAQHDNETRGEYFEELEKAGYAVCGPTKHTMNITPEGLQALSLRLARDLEEVSKPRDL